jgi:hypothetical protein
MPDGALNRQGVQRLIMELCGLVIVQPREWKTELAKYVRASWPNMSERVDYLRRLREADAHIAEAGRAVTEQMAQVEALRLAGKDTAGAQRELMAFQETLAVRKIIAPASIKQSNSSTAAADDLKQHGPLSTR